MKQTAVEWLFLMMNNPNKDQEFANRLLDKAIEMEKEQIMISYIDGSLTGCGCYDYMEKEDAEQYYNETYKG